MTSGPPSPPDALRRRLRAFASKEKAALLMRYFKTGPGQYGEGDRFLGVMVPQTRRVAREFRELPLAEVVELLRSPWHEERFCALLLLVRRFERGDASAREEVYGLYLGNTRHIDNWDLVDVSAPRIVGAFLQDRSRDPLYRLARSKRLWERRIAILATAHFIARSDFADALALSELLLGDEHDLMHKAVGWMLREVGKRDVEVLKGFLERHGDRMPRTALRYAIERFPEGERQELLRTGGRSGGGGARGRGESREETMALNADWHRKHPMPKRPTMEQRIRWHLAHAKACRCREIPESVKRALEERETGGKGRGG